MEGKEDKMCGCSQEEVINFLKKPESYGCDSNEQVELIQTHCSYIFLVGSSKAFKLERDVQFPFMDLSTLELRKEATIKEYELNGRHSKAIYEGVSAVILPRAKDDSLPFQIVTMDEVEQGKDVVVEYLVRMNQFKQSDILNEVAKRGELTKDMMHVVVNQAIAFQSAAKVYKDQEFGSSSMTWICQDNLKEMMEFGQRSPAFVDGELAEEAGKGCVALCEKYSHLLDQRLQNGKVRFCHGDLHLRNIVLINQEPNLFDCIEFNDKLAIIDVMYDFSFLLMDLLHRGMKELANYSLNIYLEKTNDYEGLALLPLFVATRAMIRAKVACASMICVSDAKEIALGRARAEEYLELARSLINYSQAKAPAVAIGGYSGSGKSSVARLLAPEFPGPLGAICLRADILRKHLANVPIFSTLPVSAYTHENKLKCYRHLVSLAQTVGKNFAVILDATFSSSDMRDLLKKENIIQGFWLEASHDKRLQRVSKRNTKNDNASDMTADILKNLKVQGTEPAVDDIIWVRIQNEGSPKDTTIMILSILRESQGWD